MASELSSTTITGEPLTSTSEIQADTSVPSQLEALALNYLRNQEISTIPSRIPKLNPCAICQRAILTHRIQSFVVLDCEHLFHRTCLEEYIIHGGTKYPSCPSCPVTIYLVRQEAVLASGEYHFRKKQTDDSSDETLMRELSFMEDDSRARQGSQSKQVTMQDQATSPIVVEDDDDNRSNSVDNRIPENQTNSSDEIRATNTQDYLENQSNANSGDDTNVQESESQSRRNSSRRRTSPRITREQERFQALLQELSTPAKGEKAENDDDAEEDGELVMDLHHKA